ncbi:hypothetical protein OpiT1DRAFT_01306 [Opitutaceae bacterium TAV1]|nr:hypothetical protein OpiT1DRAFT_01306 [Opitutaceae bacterium TAV1]
MSRNLTSPVQNAVGAQVVAPAFLCEMDFTSGFLRAWSGKGVLEWAGREFIGTGTYGGISAVEETQKVSANGVELSLSGIPGAMVSRALTDGYRGRPVRVWMALFNTESGAMLEEPVPVFAGRMNTMKLTDTGETSTVTVACESRLIDLERARERRYTDEDQKEMYPDDRGLEYVAGLQDKEVVWGRK